MMELRDYRVGILGATGAVGQTFVQLLENHPWFTVTAVAASEQSAGQPYREAVNWMSETSIPSTVADMDVQRTDPAAVNCDFVFSALSSSVAGEVEPAFAEAGIPVVSNAKNYRLHDHVPLLIPEINPEHLVLIEAQEWSSEGFIVTNPNCSTTGLLCGLYPLLEAYQVEAVQVTMLQALSGAGYPGVPSLDAIGNVIPHIEGEEEKLATEPRKILGSLQGNRIEPADLTLSAQCTRVPVRNGHLACVSVRFQDEIGVPAVKNRLKDVPPPASTQALPSRPETFVQILEAPDAPQPQRHVNAGEGMTISIGRVQECPVNDVKFVLLSHNTIRGAAGGALLNAELLATEGYLTPNPTDAVANRT